MAEVLWKECAEWLIRCQVLPRDHRVKWKTAELPDLANTLRDGVLLCHLLNTIVPGCIDLKYVSLRPQLSQFLCLKNIRTFLQTCLQCFELKATDLFEPHMLFDCTNFGRVLQTLSKLSKSPKLLAAGISGFPTSTRTSSHDYYNDDIYRNLEDLANDTEQNFGEYSENYTDVQLQEENIYEDLCSIKKTEQPQAAVPSQAPKEKRDFCIKELVETEKNYVSALNMVIRHFMRPLKLVIKLEDREVIFLKIKEMGEIHTGFHSELVKACSAVPTSPNSVTTPKISDCFLHWKDRFVVYGEYCSNLPRAQSLIDELCNKNENINTQVTQCQHEANEGKFKLRDLLSVPMQRVLKYHLLLKELIKNTPNKHADKDGLDKALEAMLDLSQFINEVKRDNEAIQIIFAIQKSITDLFMPDNMELKDYGRLLLDTELRIKSHDDNRLKNRHIFIFDRIMLMCKSTKGEQYCFKEALVLNDYKVEDAALRSSGRDKVTRWSHFWYLVPTNQSSAYTMYAKTADMKQKAIEAIKTALDNASPAAGRTADHIFSMTTFARPTTCDHCEKLLRGVFFQGYSCSTCSIKVHKDCIGLVRSCGAPSLPPRPPNLDPSPGPLDDLSEFYPSAITKAVAIRPYDASIPGHLSFNLNDTIYITQKSNNEYWEGKLSKTGEQGFFPPDHVSEFVRRPSDRPRPDTRPPAFPQSPNECSGMEEYLWFAGRMDHDTATNHLDKLPNGAFLVRISERQNGKYAISIKHDNKVKHMRVCSEDGRYYLSESKYFRTIVELVRWYEENSLSESFHGLDMTLQRPFKLNLMLANNAPVGYAVANYDFEATAPNMLSLKKGDAVTILSKKGGDKGWWNGQVRQQVGFFPLAYVTEKHEGFFNQNQV